MSDVLCRGRDLRTIYERVGKVDVEVGFGFGFGSDLVRVDWFRYLRERVRNWVLSFFSQ